jgi:hypothetical protein
MLAWVVYQLCREGGVCGSGSVTHNQHEYGTIQDLMTPLKPLSNAKMLIPYEQFYIQSLHQADKLISEQYPGEVNPLVQLAIHPLTLHSRVSRATSL